MYILKRNLLHFIELIYFLYLKNVVCTHKFDTVVLNYILHLELCNILLRSYHGMLHFLLAIN